MAQLFSAIFFCLACIAALAMIATMLHGEWARVAAILSGRELAVARATVPQMRVRLRASSRTEPRRPPQPLRAAA
ncbi:MAG TPA: hypothetical protein VE567_04160 [Sphingomonas sp.]|nr:hypothetical protein [Sphingomonas sp.]